jgi:MerR family Zn(II)-responsive transcriptional regulator of zntA
MVVGFRKKISNMLISELAKKTGLSAHTIRYYEKFGLVRGTRPSGRSTNNYLHYDDEAAYRLELIRDAKAAGFTLNEIKALIEVWLGNGFTVQQKVAILDEKLTSIDEKIRQLEAVKVLIADFKEEVKRNNC